MYLGKSFKHYLEENKEVGFVETLNFPLVGVSGLPNVFLGEVVVFEDENLGIVMTLDEDIAHVLLLDEVGFKVGDKLARTKQSLKIAAHEKLLGGAYDCLGKSLMDSSEGSAANSASVAGVFQSSPGSVGLSAISGDSNETTLMEVFNDAPDFPSRAKVSDPLVTGVSIVDLMVPLGKGQRELILGDKKSGKTEFLMQVILSQVSEGSICIYAGIGKNKGALLDVLDFSRQHNLGDKFMLVGTSSSDSAGEVYLTPYTAMAFAEYFRNQGRDVVLILDDMSSHAKYYRELSLVGGSFPGRESYPGDIFFIHSQLFERAGNFKNENGTSSITCLPVAETVEGDISGYIQTNLMSMTDGHVFFDSALFDEGNRPAVDAFLSVTRVGRQVQSKLHQSLNRELSGFLNLLRKHKRFVHFGAELSEGIRTSLETGEKVTAFFRQPPRQIYPLHVQYLLFTMIWGGLITPKQIQSLKFLGKKMKTLYKEDADFRRYLDNLVNTSEDFNALLAAVMKEQETIKELLGINI
ncbi:hypothetical protein GF360_04335 [candidate division WWE3 bacterium]|nr:hypothetical protein [candidate division WWE3 bacterium]